MIALIVQIPSGPRSGYTHKQRIALTQTVQPYFFRPEGVSLLMGDHVEFLWAQMVGKLSDELRADRDRVVGIWKCRK